MAYDPTQATNVTVTPDGADLLITWTGNGVAGQLYQVYVARHLAWSGSAVQCIVPFPGGSRVAIDVGAITTADIGTDFSSSLPAISGGGDRALLAWTGGTYLDASGNGDVKGFKVFASLVAGGAISYTAPVADIPAYAGDVPLDGFGMGGFGSGGFGFVASSYTWQSGPLTRGVWSYDVQSYDHAGNLSSVSTTSVTIATAPRPPSPNVDGLRLTRTYDPTTHTATLAWLASPG